MANNNYVEYGADEDQERGTICGCCEKHTELEAENDLANEGWIRADWMDEWNCKECAEQVLRWCNVCKEWKYYGDGLYEEGGCDSYHGWTDQKGCVDCHDEEKDEEDN